MEVLVAEGLCQVALHSGSKRARPRRLIRKSGNQNGGNGFACRDQPSMEVESRHPRHLHVGDETAEVATLIGSQEILGAAEGDGIITKRFYEADYSLADGFVVVDDCNDGCVGQFHFLIRPST